MCNTGKNCWISGVNFLLDNIGVDRSNLLDVISKTKLSLIDKFKSKWESSMKTIANQQVGKLRTFALFKNKFVKEQYFDVIKNFDVRKCFTSFRISSHTLEIERGRYRKVDVTYRKCKICKSDCVEDEFHFIFECQRYNCERKSFMEHIDVICSNFKYLSNKNKLVWLMVNENEKVINTFAEYIYSSFQMRNKYLQSG